MNIKVENLSKKYGDQTVLKNLTFTLEGVKSLGIIGGSGCGKSTLLRHLSGIEAPDSGKIFVDQMSPWEDQKKFREEIGVVFQKHNLFPHLTLEKNITLLLEKKKKQSKQQAKQRALEVLTQMKLEQEMAKKPNMVSGGQAQRASIARALATNPSYLFLDEPTAALDPQLTFEVLQAVDKLKSTGISFVFVTHEMKFLQQFADFFIFMKEGEIVEQGKIEGLEKPSTVLLKEFLAPYHNL